MTWAGNIACKPPSRFFLPPIPSASASLDTRTIPNMDTARKPRKRDRFRSWIKGNKTSVEATHAASTQASQKSLHHANGDRERTNERYLEAVSLLHHAVKGNQEYSNFESLDFLELVGEPEKFNDSQFREKINIAMESREKAVKDSSAWSKCKNTVECMFVALSPFAKNFLSIAQSAQSVLQTLSWTF